jgi:hypothetical protein
LERRTAWEREARAAEGIAPGVSDPAAVAIIEKALQDRTKTTRPEREN